MKIKNNKRFEVIPPKTMTAATAFKQVEKRTSKACNLHYVSQDAKYKAIASTRALMHYADKSDDYKESLCKIIKKKGIEPSKNFKLDLLRALHSNNAEEAKDEKRFEKYLYSILRVIKKLDELKIKLKDSYDFIKENGTDALSNNRLDNSEKSQTGTKVKEKAASSSTMSKTKEIVDEDNVDDKEDSDFQIITEGLDENVNNDVVEQEVKTFEYDNTFSTQDMFEEGISCILRCFRGEKFKSLKIALLEVAKVLDPDDEYELRKVVISKVKEAKNEK